MEECGMKNEIKKRIVKLFEPYLKKIEKQSNCNHIWKDKDGAAYFRCKKCGYLADDKQLDKLIFTQKLIEKGMTPDMIKQYKDYI